MSISYEEASSEPLRAHPRLQVGRAAGGRLRWLPIAGMSLALVSIGALMWRGGAEVRYQTAAIAEGTVAARVTANGTITARVTVQVGSQVSGRIQQILVDFNFRVKRGQVLAVLDGELFQASVAQARANLQAARGNLTRAIAQSKNAGRVLARGRALASKGLIAGADVERSESESVAARGDVAAARGAVAQAQAQLRQTQTNLGYTTIKSPVDGIVISRNVDVGQTVAASLQAPTLFTIAEDLGTMQVHTSVPEADVGKLQAQSKATFTVDAFPDERWEGTVREIRNASQVTQNVVTYDAVVDVENRGGRLRPGMTATVSFEYATRARAVLIPNAALRFKPRDEASSASSSGKAGKGIKEPKASKSGGQRPVYVLVDGEPERRMVRLGISDGKVTEFLDGELQVGDVVVLGDAEGGGKRSDRGGRDTARKLPTRL